VRARCSSGRRVLSCLTLAASVRKPVTTIEGLEKDGVLHPMQQAFIDQDALQCGYCTPGQILSAIACIGKATPRRARHSGIHEWQSVRCAAYPHIFAAIEQARRDTQG